MRSSLIQNLDPAPSQTDVFLVVPGNPVLLTSILLWSDAGNTSLCGWVRGHWDGDRTSPLICDGSDSANSIGYMYTIVYVQYIIHHNRTSTLRQLWYGLVYLIPKLLKPCQCVLGGWLPNKPIIFTTVVIHQVVGGAIKQSGNLWAIGCDIRHWSSRLWLLLGLTMVFQRLFRTKT